MLRLARNAALLATLAVPAAALADDDGSTSQAASSGLTNIHASKKFGLGLGGGAYSYGATGKVFLGSGMAAQAFVGLGWGGFNVGADALYEGKQLWGNGDFGLNWEAGAGAFVSTWGGIGVNAVVGLSLQFRPFPVELTADIRPTFLVGDWGYYRSSPFGAVPFDINYGGAVRYYF